MLTVAGAGVGNPEYLTKEVLERIKFSKRVVAFGRIKGSLSSIRKDIIEAIHVDEVLSFIDEKDDLLLLVSGDPCFFGIVELLKRKGVFIDKILPGISAAQYFSAKLQIPWSDAIVKSFHGRNLDLKNLKSGVHFFFTDKENSPKKILNALSSENYTGDFYAGYRLSYEDEEIVKVRIGEDIPENNKVAMALAVLDEDFKR